MGLNTEYQDPSARSRSMSDMVDIHFASGYADLSKKPTVEESNSIALQMSTGYETVLPDSIISRTVYVTSQSDGGYLEVFAWPQKYMEYHDGRERFVCFGGTADRSEGIEVQKGWASLAVSQFGKIQGMYYEPDAGPEGTYVHGFLVDDVNTQHTIRAEVSAFGWTQSCGFYVHKADSVLMQPTPRTQLPEKGSKQIVEELAFILGTGLQKHLLAE